jgi:hypothetical protein
LHAARRTLTIEMSQNGNTDHFARMKPMNGAVVRNQPAPHLTGALLLCGILGVGATVSAQTGAGGQSPPPARAQGQDKSNGKSAKTVGKEAKADSSAKTASKQTGKDAAKEQSKVRSEPSAAYQESVRQTVERRRLRRARRQAQAGDSAAVGGIVPWLMPPALVIRHTRDVHDDIGAFLFGLRY